MNNHNHQKKIALINDFTGFGRCSIAVQLPIISMMKVQCCPLPTSIFSNHTGYEHFFYTDYTDNMDAYMQEWKRLDLQFKGICTGFLGSAKQIQIVSDFIRQFKENDSIVIIDPVMGDYGKPYPTYTDEMCKKIVELVRYADIVVPNVTEACVLTDTPYKERWTTRELTPSRNTDNPAIIRTAPAESHHASRHRGECEAEDQYNNGYRYYRYENFSYFVHQYSQVHPAFLANHVSVTVLVLHVSIKHVIFVWVS